MDAANKRRSNCQFEQSGASWMDGVRLVQELNSYRMSPVRFMTVKFPSRPDRCSNQQRKRVAVELGHRIISPFTACVAEVPQALCRVYPDKFDLAERRKFPVYE